MSGAGGHREQATHGPSRPHGSATTELPAAAAAAAAATAATTVPAARTATAAATATEAATAAAAATAGAGALGLLDLDGAAVQARAVELADRRLGFLVRRHLDETEAAGAAGIAIGDDARGLDVAARGERFPQTIGGCGEGEASDEEFHSHGERSLWPSDLCSRSLDSEGEPGRGLSPRAGAHGEPATAPDAQSIQAVMNDFIEQFTYLG